MVACRRRIPFVIFPFVNFIMLQKFRRQINCECLCNVGIKIVIAAPSFKTSKIETSKQRVIRSSVITWPVQNKGILLMIADKTDHVAVNSFHCRAAVMAFRCPVLPCGIVFSLITKLSGKSPSERIKLFCDFPCLPGISVPYIQVHEVEIVCRAFICRNGFCNDIWSSHRFIFSFSHNARPWICIKRSSV